MRARGRTLHELYGLNLTIKEEALFATNGPRGINVENGKIRNIFVFTNSKYRNTFDGEVLLYYKNNDVNAKAAMESAFLHRESFPVKVKDGTKMMLWGMVIVEALPDFEGRYRMRRVRSGYTPTLPLKKELEAALAVLHDMLPPVHTQDPESATESLEDGAPSTSEDSASSSSTAPPAPPAPPAKRRRQEESTVEASMVSDDLERLTQSALAAVEGVDFHSHLERSHALLLTLLGIEWKRDETPTANAVDLGDYVSTYTPDLTLYDTVSEPPVARLVEIKPRYPYDEEIQKAVEMVRNVRIPLVLLYNTTFRSPFCARPPHANRQGKYEHADGVRGMQFSYNWTTGRVDVEYDVAYSFCPKTSKARLMARTQVNDPRFDNPYLDTLYGIVAEFHARPAASHQ